MLRRVAGFSHIWRFIAGATAIGQSRARHSVESRSSHSPLASFAMKSAEAGAISTSPLSRDSSICAMLFGTRASQASCQTGRPDTACRVTGVTNWRAASVITTSTSLPWPTSSRTSSAVL